VEGKRAWLAGERDRTARKTTGAWAALRWRKCLLPLDQPDPARRLSPLAPQRGTTEPSRQRRARGNGFGWPAETNHLLPRPQRPGFGWDVHYSTQNAKRSPPALAPSAYPVRRVSCIHHPSSPLSKGHATVQGRKLPKNIGPRREVGGIYCNWWR
jgi:hypothetical protein